MDYKNSLICVIIFNALHYLTVILKAKHSLHDIAVSASFFTNG